MIKVSITRPEPCLHSLPLPLYPLYLNHRISLVPLTLTSSHRSYLSRRVMAANANTSAITPGPGAYGTVRSSGGGSLGGLPPGPASPFVSGVPRLPIDPDTKARVAVPG